MAPPVESWPAHELADRVQVNVAGRRRKDHIDLQKCELLEMVQYECNVVGNRMDSRVVCQPIERFFRRCRDRKGSFTVETTAWEGIKN